MSTLIVQPSAKDNWLNAQSPTTNYGTEQNWQMYDRTTWTNRLIIEFDISGLPVGATITSASLQLNYHNYGDADPVGKTIWAYKLTRTDWVETESTWNIYKTSNNWTSAGGDYVTSTPAGGSTTFPAGFGWMSWDVLAIVQDAYDGSNPAEFLVKYAIEELSSNYSVGYFRPLDSVSAEVKPKLVIEYTVPSLENKSANMAAKMMARGLL